MEVNAERTKYTVMSNRQIAGQYQDIKRGDKSFESVQQSTYLRATLKHQNFIREEITSRLNSGNACPRSVQNILSSSLLYKNIQMHGTVILPVILCGGSSCSLTPREDQRLRVYENRVLRKIFGPKRVNVPGEWRSGEDYIKRSFMICIPHQILFG